MKKFKQFLLTLAATVLLCAVMSPSASAAFDGTYIDYRAWSQDQMPWGVQKLGSNNQYGSFNYYGCFMVSFAKLAVQLGVRTPGPDFNPAVVNQLFTENGITDASGQIYVDKRGRAAELVGLTYAGTISTDKDTILSYLRSTDKKYSVILHISSAGHFIPVDRETSLEKGDIYFHESWKKDGNNMSTDYNTVAATYSTDPRNESTYTKNLIGQKLSNIYGRASHAYLFYAPSHQHKYEFNKSTKLASCVHCDDVYYLPATTKYEAFMDVVAVNKDSNSAPVHNEPYGDSVIPNDFRYHLGDTVYVTGYVKNAFGNTWYQLSGGEWVTGDYLGTHSHRYNSNGYCTRCLDKLSIVFMYMKEFPPLPAVKGSPIHYAPYGDSAKLPVTCGSSVTINGKIVNGYGNIWYSVAEGGWVYGNYITSTVQLGTVNFDGGSLAVHNHPDASSPQLGMFSAGQEVYVYLDETIGNWYSVFGYDVNTRRAGFVDLNRITLQSGNSPGDYDDYKGLEPLPEPIDPPVGDTPSTPSTPSGPSTVSLSYPTDPTYTGKITVGETNATVVSHIAKPAGTHVSACGLRLYDASWNLIKDHYETLNVVKDSATTFHAWYDIQAELGVTLTPASTYYYQFYTVVDGGTYSGETLSFTTAGARVSYPTDPTYTGKFAFSDTNATVVAAITKPAGSRASACGLRLYDASWNLIKDHYEELNFIKDSATTFHAWYDIQAELGITLTPGTTYYYQFYTVVNGGTYSGESLSFTTTGTAPHTHTYDAVVTAPTCTQDGYTTYTCPCSESYKADEIPALGHSYDNEQDVSCNVCSEEREVILPDAPEETPSVSGIVMNGAGAAIRAGSTESNAGADGSFRVAVSEGTFDVTVKQPGYLTHTVKNITANGADVELGVITLLAGDTNGDDMINIMDMAAFRQNFGKSGDAVTNAFTDTNGDGMVNIMDMGTFRKNFGKTAAKDCTVEYSA